MAIFYISAEVGEEELVFTMNATTRIKTSSSGELSAHNLENGDTASDNYRNKPEMIQMSGIISDVVSSSNSELKPTKDYLQGLEKLKKDKIPFTVHFGSDLTPKYPCFFKNFSYTQDTTNGFSGVSLDGRHINAYSVSMEIEVARIGKLSQIQVGKASEFVDPTQTKSEASAATKTVSEEDVLGQGIIEATQLWENSKRDLEEGLRNVDLPGGS